MRLMALETDRLLIRPYEQADLTARHELMQQCFGSEDTLEQTQAWLTWTIAGYDQFAKLHQPPYGDYAVVLKESGVVIGAVGMVPSLVPWGVLNDAKGHEKLSPEMGLFWAILPDQQKRGYAVEAAQRLIQFIFEELGIYEIVATTEFENAASIRVMEKLDMRIFENTRGEPAWCQVVGVSLAKHPQMMPHD